MKHTGGKLLRLLAVLTALLCFVLMGGGTAEEVLKTETVEAVVQDPRGLSNEDAAEQFIYQQLGWDEMVKPLTPVGAKRGGTARSRLGTIAGKIYDALRPKVLAVAAGEQTSTIFQLPLKELFPDGCTLADLGAADTDEAGSRLIALAQDAVSALMADEPYNLYWYDKTGPTSCGVNGYWNRQDGISFEDIKGSVVYLTIQCPVAQAYAQSTYAVTTTLPDKVKTAADTAKKIVANNAGKSDYNKLCAYKAAICSLTDYNDEAARTNPPYGDPWQLIYVFDGNPDTTVVCEGYSKAFQYLCDLSTFTVKSTKAISVSGYMWTSEDTERGRHMWNIVTLNGRRYLADVTNSDNGSIGQCGELFLAGYDEHNERDEYYRYDIARYNEEVFYAYNSNTVSEFGAESGELDTADTGYTNVIATGNCGDSGTNGDNVTWILYDSGLLFINGTGNMSNYSAYSVNPIEEYKSRITSVVISEGVIRIGNQCFCQLANLTDIILPDSLTEIGESAFLSCSSLTIVRIPDHVISIDNYAFSRCSGLMEIVIPANVDFIGTNAFENCSGLTSITIPDKLENLSNYTFSGCSGLRSVVFPEGLKTIQENAFSSCTALTDVYYCGTNKLNITITNNGNEILNNVNVKWHLAGNLCGDHAFWSLSEDGTLTIAGSGDMKNYGYESNDRPPWFNDTGKIKKIIIEKGITSIGNRAFEVCTELTSIELPEGLERIGDIAFRDCRFLSSITIPLSVTYIGSDALNNCTLLKDIYFNRTAEEWAVVNKGQISSNPTIHYAEEAAEATWTWDIPVGWPDVLIISGTGAVSLPAGETDWPWSGLTDGIKRVIIEKNITGLGAGALAGFNDGLRVDFLGNSVPTLTANTFGTNTVVCRYFTENNPWTGGGDNVSWIYLPFQPGTQDLELRYLAQNDEGKKWVVDTRTRSDKDSTAITAAQAKELTYDDRWIEFDAIPTVEADRDVFMSLDAPTVLIFSDKCLDSETATFNFGSLRTGNLRFVETYAKNLPLTITGPIIPAGSKLPDLIVHEGATVTYTGSINDLTLNTTQFSNPAVTITGGVNELAFYDASSDRPYKGTLNVTGTIANITVHGQGGLYIPGISKDQDDLIVFNNLALKNYTDVHQEQPVIILADVDDGKESRLNIDGNATSAAVRINLDDCRFDYHFYSDRISFDLRSKDGTIGYGSIYNILLNGYNPDFTYKDLIQDADTVVYVENTGANNPGYDPVLTLGDNTMATGIGTLYLENCRVNVNFPVDMIMVWQHADKYGPVYATINSTVDTVGLILGQDGGKITVGENGIVNSGYWERRIYGQRNFGTVNAGETLMDDGHLCVLSSKENQTLKAILPSDKAVTTAARSSTGHFASLDVDQKALTYITDSNLEALNTYLTGRELTTDNVWAVMNITVNDKAETGTDDPAAVSQLDSAVPISIANAAGEGAVVIRLHNGEAEALTNTSGNNEIYQFSSDLFSPYVLVSTTPYCAHEHTAYRQRWITEQTTFTDVGDNGSHKVTGVFVDERYCTDCGEVLYTSEGTAVTDEYYEHTYSGQNVSGVETIQCTQCGHVNTCAHANTAGSYQWLADPVCAEIEGNNAKHKATGKALVFDVCYDCGVWFKVRTVDNYEANELHSYTNGVCSKCNHTNTCTHANLTHEVQVFDPTGYTSVDNDTHTVTGSGRERDYCPDCECYFNSQDKENLTKVEHHVYSGGVCENCGHACTHEYDSDYHCPHCGLFCPHTNAQTVIESTETSYRWVSTEKHAAITTTRSHLECADCGWIGVDEEKTTEVEENHTDTNNDDICDVCGNSISDPWIAEGNWDLQLDDEGNVLYIRGSGKMPDYPAGTKAPWTDAVAGKSIDRIVIAEGITRIGANDFKNLGKTGETVRVEFVDEDNGTVRKKPDIAESAFSGTTVICRYYNQDSSWPTESSQWVYLPRYEAQTPGRLPVSYGPVNGTNCWNIGEDNTSNNIPLSLMQARELTYKRRELDLFALPEGNDQKLYTESSIPLVMSLNTEEAGTFTLDADGGGNVLYSLEVMSPNLTVNVNRSVTEPVEVIRVHSGTLNYTGNTKQLELLNSNDDSGTVNYTGNITELDFYGPDSAGNKVFKGNVFINGSVTTGLEYGSGTLTVAPVGDIDLNDAICKKFTFTSTSDTQIIKDNKLILNEGVTAYAVKLEDYKLIYQFYDDHTMLKLKPKVIGNECELNLTELMAKKNAVFTADQIIWGADTEVDVHFWTTPQTLNLNGDNGTGFDILFINATVGTVNLNCPVEHLSIAHDFARGRKNALTLNINSTVKSSAKFEIMGNANVITLGNNGALQPESSEWSRYMYAKRSIPSVAGACTLVKDGQLCILTALQGETLKSILPGDSALKRAAGRDAVMEISEIPGSLNDSEQAALAQITDDSSTVAQVFEVRVTKAGGDDDGDEMTSLAGNARMAVGNTSGQNAYIVRFHDYGDERGIVAERVSAVSSGGTLWFESDLFSTFAIVKGTPSACGEGHHTLTAVAAVPATCVENGTKAYWECSACGKLFADEQGTTPIDDFDTLIISATGNHTVSLVAEKPETCTVAGCKAHWECSVCGALFFDDGGAQGTPATPDALVIPAAHKLERQNRVAPTIGTAGCEEHWKCSVCDKLFEDEHGEIETTPAALVIPALSNVCGESLTWAYDEDTNTLTISGTGAMDDYSATVPPWDSLKGNITSVSISEDATNVTNAAFAGCSSLTSIYYDGLAIDDLPDGVTQYWSVNIATGIENGTITAQEWAAEGTSVSLTITPATGYEQDTLTVTDGNGENVTVTEGAFNMPAGKVTVSGTFKKIPAVPPPGASVDDLTLSEGYSSSNSLMVTAPLPIVDDHTYSYRWYSNTTSSIEGGTPIEGETDAYYTIPTGGAAGVYYYYCVVTATRKDNGESASRTSNVATVTINHVADDAAEEDRVEATCTEPGSYNSVVRCSVCHEIISSTPHVIDALDHAIEHHDAQAPTCTEVGWNAYDTCTREGCDYSTYEEIPALGHDWGEPDYHFADDGSSCTATRTCTRVASHVETYNATITSEVTTPATCTTKGKTTYTAKFTDSTLFETQYKTVEDVPVLGHDPQPVSEVPAGCTTPGTAAHWKCSRCDVLFSDANGEHEITAPDPIPAAHTLVHHEAVEPKCTTDGNYEYWQCSVCETYFADEQGATETTEQAVMRSQIGHDYVHHDGQAATCTVDGWKEYDTCSRCDYTTYEKIDALGHNWEVEYSWADDNSKCTASGICQRDTSHKFTDTVNTTSAVTTQPTCEGMGKTTYTATFSIEGAKTQTKTVENIGKLGHEWKGKVRYTWSGDYSTVTAAEVCERDGNHTRDTETVRTTAKVDQSSNLYSEGRDHLYLGGFPECTVRRPDQNGPEHPRQGPYRGY